jgi:hypothetical protein
MKTTFKARRYGILAAATVICVLGASVVANATFSLTVPNSVTYIYSLGVRQSTAPITPPSNQPVLLIGAQSSTPAGVAQVTLEHIPGSNIMWTGLDCPPMSGNSTITSGSAAAPGVHIAYLDQAHAVDVEVAGPDTILIYNNGGYAQGSIELIW